MKINNIGALLTTGLAFEFLAFTARAADPTAFGLIPEGDRYVGEQAKDKIVQIRSDKSAGTVMPNVWYVVFYDPTASLKAAEVKFAGGRMVTVTRPMRLLEPISGGDQPLDRSKLKVDSNQALQTAENESGLKDVKLTASQMKLERVGQGVLGTGGPGEAVWKIKLWAAKSGHDQDIGEIWIDATEGKVVKSDLHTNRLN
jgi:hypothetical protein